MRVVLVGCGNMAEGWLKAIQESPLLKARITLVGLVDLNIAAAQALAAKFGLSNISLCADLQESIAVNKPDALFDVTVPEARPIIVRAGLEAGLHVLSEKPMAPNMQVARDLMALADRKGLSFSIAQNRRYKQGIRRVEAFLRKGGIGEITGLHADFFIGARFGGFREEMDHVLLLDMAIHTFDAARFMSNQKPLRVQCIEANPNGSWYGQDASAFATFEMSNNVIFSYRGSWCAEGSNTSWDASWRITGTKGTLHWDGEQAISAHIATGEEAFLRDSVETIVPKIDDITVTQEHASVIAAFLDGVKNNHRPETDSADNLHSLAMVFAAIESAKRGCKIDISSN
ncbi:MAG: Gfo/Idh/MocA family oxidoreductase [Rhodobacteraceae bacterium]|nr:Gfo/Idh/MocA family oxidoreductase [Paracoccaceae bacterium]PHR53864.1 MAG: oxidoreductase [Robiginitomaculum sp.]